jgi:hypothetical protein
MSDRRSISEFPYKSKSDPQSGLVYTAGFTCIQHEFFDTYYAILSKEGIIVYCYLCRRATGYGHGECKVSLSQICGGYKRKDGKVMDSGTGLRRSKALKGIRDCETLNLIRWKKGDRTHISVFEIVDLKDEDQTWGVVPK